MQSSLHVPNPAVCWSIYLPQLHFYIMASSNLVARIEEFFCKLEEETGSNFINSADTGANERDEGQE